LSKSNPLDLIYPKKLFKAKNAVKNGLEGRKVAVRATLIVKGNVQGAGYRAKVMKQAQELELCGEEKNLPDGNVQIICEGEKKTIEKLIELIKMKNIIAEVDSIETTYDAATGEFDEKGFTVKVPDPNYELFQGYATSEKYFGSLLEKESSTLGAVEKMHSDMNKNFSIMAKRYDLIAKSLNKGLEMIGQEFVRSRKEVATALIGFDKTIKMISKK